MKLHNGAISMSKMQLLRSCSWWARPDVAHHRVEPAARAKTGTIMHAAICAWLTGSTLLDLEGDAKALFDRWLDSSFAVDLLELQIETELAVWFDFEHKKGGIRRDIQDRKYEEAASPFVIWGTADLMIHREGHMRKVIDWKSGRHAPAARNNGQLLSLTSALCGKDDWPQFEASIVHITEDRLLRVAH